MQEHCQQQRAPEISPAQYQCKTEIHETHGVLGHVQTVADREEASKPCILKECSKQEMQNQSRREKCADIVIVSNGVIDLESFTLIVYSTLILVDVSTVPTRCDALQDRKAS